MRLHASQDDENEPSLEVLSWWDTMRAGIICALAHASHLSVPSMRRRVRRGEDDGAGQVARGEGASLPGVPEGASLAGPPPPPPPNGAGNTSATRSIHHQ